MIQHGLALISLVCTMKPSSKSRSHVKLPRNWKYKGSIPVSRAIDVIPQYVKVMTLQSLSYYPQIM